MMKTNTGCLMLFLDRSNFKDLLESLNINKDQLHEQGCESDPHVTILYGLPSELLSSSIDVESIKSLIKESKLLESSFNFENIGMFNNEEYDVIKCEPLESKEVSKLRFINTSLTNKYNVKSDFDSYKPHCTIGYFQKGFGKDYVKTMDKVYPMKVTKVVFSSKLNEDGSSNKVDLMVNRSELAKDFLGKELF